MQARTDRHDIQFLNDVIDTLNNYMIENELSKKKSKDKTNIRKIATAIYEYAGQPLTQDHMDSILNGNLLFFNIADIDTSLKTAPENFSKLVQDIQDILATMHTSISSSNSLNSQIQVLLNDEDMVADNLIQLSNAQNQREAEQAHDYYNHNKVLPVVGAGNHEILGNIFTFFTPLEFQKKLRLVSRDWFAVSNDPLVLKELMKAHFYFSDDQLNKALTANNESLEKTLRQLVQRRTFFLLPSHTGMNHDQQLTGLNSYTWFKHDKPRSSKSSSENFWLSKLFANPCYPTIETACAAYETKQKQAPNGTLIGVHVILELQLALEKTIRLIKEERFEELATYARKAYSYSELKGISKAISIEFATDIRSKLNTCKQFIQTQKLEEQNKPAYNTPRKK